LISTQYRNTSHLAIMDNRINLLLKNAKAMEYSTNEMCSDEALQAFRQLYMTIREKGFGIDKVFDEIIDGYNSQYAT